MTNRHPLRRVRSFGNLLRLLALLLPVLLGAAAPARAQEPGPAELRGFDADVARAMKEFQVPGLAIAVVRDGAVLLAKGYGIRTLGRSEPVTAHTLFQIASNTKAFTTASLAILVDEGKLRWDDRVIDHLPWFRLYDPYVTREMTVRDLLTHRSGLGLGAGDLLWLRSDYPFEEIARRIRVIPPETSFRTAYAYDNVLYGVAGALIPAVTGKRWEDFVGERILQPLGMTDVVTLASRIPAQGDVATPHSTYQGALRIVPRDTMDNNAPAGAIAASVSDLTRWMIVQLDSGRIRGPARPVASNGGENRLWTQKRAKEMWTGVTPQPIGDRPAGALGRLTPNFSEYALGWQVRDYRGYKLATHTGGLAGMTSRTLLVPELKLGIVVLTNMESGAHTALAWTVLDRFLQAPRTDWIGEIAAQSRRSEAEAAEVEGKAAAARVQGTRPSLALQRYAGDYTDAMYGDASIRFEDGRLVLRFAHSPAFVADLEHWNYDTFVARWRERTIPDAYVTFGLTPTGAIDDIVMAPVSPLADFSFDYQDLRFTPKK